MTNPQSSKSNLKISFSKEERWEKANPIFYLYNFKPELTPGKSQAKIQQHEHLFEHLHLHVSLIMTKANTDILFWLTVILTVTYLPLSLLSLGQPPGVIIETLVVVVNVAMSSVAGN